MHGGGRDIRVSGWVKAKRKSKNVTFLHVACGNLTSPVQCVLVHSQVAVPHDLSVGNAVTLHGDVVESQGGGQSHELNVKSISLDCESSMTVSLLILNSHYTTTASNIHDYYLVVGLSIVKCGQEVALS